DGRPGGGPRDRPHRGARHRRGAAGASRRPLPDVRRRPPIGRATERGPVTAPPILDEGRVVSNRDAVRAIVLALRYVRPFAGRFVLKAVLVLVSVACLLLLPFPAKVLIDHVILAQPVAAEHNPLLRETLLGLGVTDRGALFVAMAAMLAGLLVLIGAVGTSGVERATVEARLGAGQDTATRTENEVNAGFSLVGGLL